MRRSHLLLLLPALLLGLRCGPPPESPPGTFKIEFRALFGDTDFACGQSVPGLGAGASTFTPSDLRLFIHDLEAIDAQGAATPLVLKQDGVWQHQSLALLDFEDATGPCANGSAEVRTFVEALTPASELVGLRFTLGVPFELNHGDVSTAPSPLSLSSMFWSWNAGYKFLRFEGATEAQAGWRAHVGSTLCQGEIGAVTGCDRPNRAEFTLPAFDPEAQAVIFDLSALVKDIDLDANTAGTAVGCMGGIDDPECGTLLSALGLDPDTGLPSAAHPSGFVRAQ